MLHSQSIQARFIQACRRAWDCGLLAGCNGNISIRLGRHCLITRSGAAKGHLSLKDLLRVNLHSGAYQPLAGHRACGLPSSELGMHLALYAARSETRAIVHVHPARLLALSLRVPPDKFVSLPLFEAEKAREQLAFVPALPPGSAELAQAVAQAACQADAVWMQGHGLTCLGTSLQAALALAEELEHLAGVQLLL